MALRGAARLGQAGLGLARRCKARQGKASQGTAWRGEPWLGQSRQGFFNIAPYWGKLMPTTPSGLWAMFHPGVAPEPSMQLRLAMGVGTDAERTDL